MIIREIQRAEYPLLEDFLYEAIFIPSGVVPPPRSIISRPELQVYISGFGTGAHDFAFIAEMEGNVVGAVWVRIMNDYGHIDDETPSFAISVYKEYRGKGIGTALMKEMLTHLARRGYRQASLSVQKENFAVGMYRKLGFQIVKDSGDEYVMLKKLNEKISRT